MVIRHTPGEWGQGTSTNPLLPWAPKSCIYADGGILVAQISEDDVPSEEQNANAALICAAPDMLAVIEQIMKDNLPMRPDTIYDLKCAHAKATGTTP